jgi:hypothetical protein
VHELAAAVLILLADKGYTGAGDHIAPVPATTSASRAGDGARPPPRRTPTEPTASFGHPNPCAQAEGGAEKQAADREQFSEKLKDTAEDVRARPEAAGMMARARRLRGVPADGQPEALDSHSPPGAKMLWLSAALSQRGLIRGFRALAHRLQRRQRGE